LAASYHTILLIDGKPHLYLRLVLIETELAFEAGHAEV
jgi:hypothetical protein